MRILITGGAGYIGSHVALHLAERGHETVVFDNLATGHADAVRVPLVRGDLCRAEEVRRAIEEHRPDAVMHFAARSLVSESVRDPRLYFYENLVGALNLLDAMRANGVRRFVFSSTAATYGVPREVPIPETHPQVPVNPYGDTKLAIERMLVAYERAYGIAFAILRYFNAAGAAPEHGLGERHDPETHLIPMLLKVATGERPEAEIYGRDYETPDGTCVRDYIHVLDLAEAHALALEALGRGASSLALNLGTGRGHSVLEVLACAREVTGAAIPARDSPRRAGDPPVLVAAPGRARELIGFTPTRSELRPIVESAWAFERGGAAATPRGR
jgi:UDP-glucose-4-epimerase GalE